MSRLKCSVFVCISCAVFLQTSNGKSIDLSFFQRVTDPNGTYVTTPFPTISDRIQASLNVLRIPLPVWGTSGASGASTGVLSPAQSQPALAAIRPGSQPAPGILIPIGINAVQSTFSQLSTLTHWPFAYETTPRYNTSGAAITERVTEKPRPATEKSTFTISTASPPEVITAASLPPLPPPTTTPMSLPPPPPTTAKAATLVQPQSLLGPPTLIFNRPIPPLAPGPSLPDRIHNRLQSTIGNYIRLPNLAAIGQPRPVSMITEPPWVTELLGPTLEPPTTRAPTLGERVTNTINNALLFVPATLLNFWYENWGPQHVDRIIQNLRVSTPKPGTTDPVFATLNQQNFNFSETDLPAIAAFINNNGTFMPTLIHPVLNKTTNTIEYLLRSDNETSVLWTGSLSNDIFKGDKTVSESEDDEDEQIKSTALNIHKYKTKVTKI